MPRRSQKGEKKPLEMASRRPSRSSAAALPQEKPHIAVDTRKLGATSDVVQPPLETSKMADNWKHLNVRAPADSKLFTPTSSPSNRNQLEVVQTRRSFELSTEKENTDFNFSIELPPPPVATKTPKRSATPVPPSFLDQNNKMRKMTPPHLLFDNPKANSSDAKLPVAAVKDTSFQNKENVDPLSQSNRQASASRPARIEEASCEPMEIAARGLLGPSGLDEYYLAQFHKFYKDYQDCNDKANERMHKLETSNTDKHYENLSLKSRLKIMTDENEKLKERLLEKDQENSKVQEKYLNALKTRTAVEMGCKSQLQMAKSLVDQQKAELGEYQTEIDHLRAELNIAQETNRGMASALSDLQTKLKQAEGTAANLLNENNKQAAELDEQKLKMQETVAEREVFERRVSQLESELKEKTLQCSELNQRHLDFEKQQLLNDEIANQLEFSRNERELMQNELNECFQELQAAQNSLYEMNENYAKESVELKAQKEAQEEIIHTLRSSFVQQSHDYKELVKSHEKLEAANFQQVALHSKELEDYKAKNMSLLDIIKSFETKLQVQARSLQAEQEKVARETQQSQLLKSKLEGERKRLQADIDALKTALGHRDRESSAEQAKMQCLEAQLEELRKIIAGLKTDKNQMDNKVLDAKKLVDELKCQTNNLESKILGLQEDLKKKDTQLIAIEHEKNGVIQQLKDKMNAICSTIEQPIVASTTPRSPRAQKYTKRQPKVKQQEVKPTVAIVNSPLSSFKGRKANRIEHIHNDSDFESEDYGKPIQMRFSKRENLAVVMPREEEGVFDALKKGNI